MAHGAEPDTQGQGLTRRILLDPRRGRRKHRSDGSGTADYASVEGRCGPEGGWELRSTLDAGQQLETIDESLRLRSDG